MKWLGMTVMGLLMACSLERPGVAVTDAASGGTDATSVETDAAPPEPIVVTRMNVDGPRHEGIDFPGVWSPDPGICGPNPYNNPNPIGGTQDDALFHDVMWGNPVTCSIGGGKLVPGVYAVKLLFAEIYFGEGCPGGGGVGNRVFDIVIEGVTVLSGLDVFEQAGCAVETAQQVGRPIFKLFVVTVDDGTLDIALPATANQGFLSALEVLWMPGDQLVGAREPLSVYSGQ